MSNLRDPIAPLKERKLLFPILIITVDFSNGYQSSGTAVIVLREWKYFCFRWRPFGESGGRQQAENHVHTNTGISQMLAAYYVKLNTCTLQPYQAW